MSHPPPISGTLLHHLIDDEAGTTTIEYGLIAFVISLSILAAASALGLGLGDIFSDLGAVFEALFGG